MDFDMEEVMEMEHALGRNAKKPSDPNAPKRPFSAYFLWANKTRSSVVQENPEATMGDIGKLLGTMWKKVSDKSEYEAKSKKQRATYEVKMEKYKKTSNYKKFQMELLAWKIHETKKPFKQDPNAPKRNSSAYMLYITSVRKQIVEDNPDMEHKDIMREQSVWWKALNEKDRAPWVAKAAAAKKKYAAQVERYMKTADYRKYTNEKDEYKQSMLMKRNKLMGIKKRARSKSKPSKSPARKRQKRRSTRSSRSASRRRTRRARRSRTPKSSKSRSRRRSTSRRRARR